MYVSLYGCAYIWLCLCICTYLILNSTYSYPFRQQIAYRTSAWVWCCLADVASFCCSLSVQVLVLSMLSRLSFLSSVCGLLLCSTVPFPLLVLQFEMSPLWHYA